MKKLSIIKFILAIPLLCLALAGHAQYEDDSTLPGFWTFTWDIGLPVAKTSDFTDNLSGRGFTIQGRKFIKSNISVGGSLGWHVFKESIEQGMQDFSTEINGQMISGTLSGDQFRYINSFPILANVNFYNGALFADKIVLHAGLGLGTSIVNRRIEVGTFFVDETTWRLAIAPEVGATLRINNNYSLMANVRYLHAFEAASEPTTSYFSFSIGFISSIYSNR